MGDNKTVLHVVRSPLRDTDLQDFANAETGWRVMQASFADLANAYMERAARAKAHDEHLLCLGALEGVERAWNVLKTLRENMRGTPEGNRNEQAGPRPG